MTRILKVLVTNNAILLPLKMFPSAQSDNNKKVHPPLSSSDNAAFTIDRCGKAENDFVPNNAVVQENEKPSFVEPKIETSNLPTLQMEEYLSTKMRLAQIMRDFNDKKICFIGTDESKVFIQQYHTISSRVKQGEDICQYLKGKLVVFVTGIDKKKKINNRNKIVHS